MIFPIPKIDHQGCNSTQNIEKNFIDFLVELSKLDNKGFSGAGFVLYHNLNSLTEYHCNLANGYTLPLLQLGTDEFNSFIIEISNFNHPYHDGFHFINSNGILTHITQFFSPPVNKIFNNVDGQGARTFCSQIGSTLKGVILVGSVSTKKTIYLFKKGKLMNINTMTHKNN